MSTTRRRVGVTAALLLAGAAAWAGAADGLLALFDRYDVVAVADQRGVEQLAELYATVACSDGFVAHGIEIVADFGSPAHQGTVDSYLAGGTVAEGTLRSAVAGAPAFRSGGAPRSYETLLAAIRAASSSRPAAGRIRVWLPAVDEDGSAGLAARVIERLAAGRKVLLIADPMELVAGGIVNVMRSASKGEEPSGTEPKIMTMSVGEGELPEAAFGGMEPQPSCLARIEEAQPGRTTTVYPFCGLDDQAASGAVEAEIAARGVGSLTPIAGSGAAALLRSSMGFDLVSGRVVAPVIAGMDRLLYVGPVASLTVAPVRKSEKARTVVEIAASRPKRNVQLRTAP